MWGRQREEDGGISCWGACKPGGGGCGFYINKKNKNKKSTQSDLLNYENIVN